MDYTVVLGVDRHTIELFRLVFPTWVKYKTSLFDQPWLIFYDGIDQREIENIIKDDFDHDDVQFVKWPPLGIEYPRDNLTKWTSSQRAKMLAGFVHVPASHVKTPYWLKLDLDVVATGMSDWVQDNWFDGNPSIIAPGWSYSKPPDCMLKLDRWADRSQPQFLHDTEPLNLIPNEGSDKVCHSRICSWCAFFSTEFTKLISRAASNSCGWCQLPIDSQDGVMWYCAYRGGFTIRTFQPKKFGWKLRHSLGTVRTTVGEVMA